MKIKVENTTITEVEITLPAYRTDGICHWYKVYSEEYCLTITLSDGFIEVSRDHAGLGLNSNTYPRNEITKEEFELKLAEAIDTLKKINESC